MKFKDMQIGDQFHSSGKKFDDISVEFKKGEVPVFEKINSTQAQEVIDPYGDQTYGEIINVGPEEDGTCAWET